MANVRVTVPPAIERCLSLVFISEADHAREGAKALFPLEQGVSSQAAWGRHARQWGGNANIPDGRSNVRFRPNADDLRFSHLVRS
jgi:hypothetical protein